ncbi:MAG TPA: c-type cytochrome domain-containing protein, partial [Gemmataceae bacterium]|nr:c-type cytochrome domain-containing protein [Gemmataceae bacterium]
MLGPLLSFPRVLLASALALCAAAGAAAAAQPDPAQAEFFEKEIRPVLAEQCFRCHGRGKVRGGLTLTSRAALLQGGNTGPAAVPGKPDESLLLEAVRQGGDLKMPPKGKLTAPQIAALDRWVRLGLPWPEGPAVTARGSPDSPFTAEQRRWWSFQPVKVV